MEEAANPLTLLNWLVNGKGRSRDHLKTNHMGDPSHMLLNDNLIIKKCKFSGVRPQDSTEKFTMKRNQVEMQTK